MLNDTDGEHATTSESTAEQQPLGRSSDSSSDSIPKRAYELYFARGCEDGHDVEDWLEAEREYRLGTE